jgi:hypothetical protein
MLSVKFSTNSENLKGFVSGRRNDWRFPMDPPINVLVLNMSYEHFFVSDKRLDPFDQSTAEIFNFSALNELFGHTLVSFIAVSYHLGSINYFERKKLFCLNSFYLGLTKSSKIIKKKYKGKEKVQVLFY